MGIPGSANPLLLTNKQQYLVQRSVRFNSSDSGFCSRTFTSAGNRKTWTWAGWVKRGKMGYNNSTLFYCRTADSDTGLFQFRFGPSDRLDSLVVNGWATNFRVTNALFRDASAWYHIVLAFDSTQASDANRCKIYVNGVEQTFSTSSAFTQNADYGINQAATHNIGVDLSTYFDGYLADIHFIDGQALTPSSFTEVSATTGQLIPKKYTGTFGTNGFWLQFADNSSNTATTLGKDSSGNGNNWTPTNFSVTAGAGNDSLVDTPTSYGTDTGAGGEVRGNYCINNPLDTGSGITLANGTLDLSIPASSSVWWQSRGSIGVTSGKWYWEVTVTTNQYIIIGVARGNVPLNTFPGNTADGWGWAAYAATKYNNASGVAYGSATTSGDVVGVAYDADNSTLTFYKNGVSQGSAYTNVTTTSGPIFPSTSINSLAASSCVVNYGQRPFAYTAPSGFKALCDTNLPTPVVAKPSTVMDVALWTGNGGNQSITLPGGFNPDLVWVKSRSNAQDHYLFDAVRGGASILRSNTTGAETTGTTFLSFDTSGFSSLNGLSSNGYTYAGWAWDAGSSTVTNTAGSITSSVRANASAGFSIITFVCPTSGGSYPSYSVGHGLNVAPVFFVAKDRSNGTTSWITYHASVTDTVNKYLVLNGTGAVATASNIWGTALPSSTVINLTANTGIVPGSNAVIYAFAPVAGYSTALSWTGNGSSDGPLLHCGFLPRFFIAKRTDAANDWWMWDTARSNTGNPVDEWLSPNRSDAEYGNDADFDFLSNGIKIRNTSATVNASGGTYIGFAWASNPFQYARAQ